MRSGGQKWKDDCLKAIELIKQGTFDADLEEFGQDGADLETVSDYILQEVRGKFAPLRKASKVLEP